MSLSSGEPVRNGVHPSASYSQIDATPVGVVVVHPGALMRIGLSELLRLTPEAQLLACVATGTELLGAIRQHRPDLIILPPEFRELAASLKQPPRMMLISPDDHPGDTGACEHSCAFCNERASFSDLQVTLKAILTCERLNDTQRACLRCPLRGSLSPGQLPLSPRELEVFDLIGHYRGASQIAQKLGIGVKTVETYRRNIMHKLGLDSSTALTVTAVLWRRGTHPVKSTA